MAYELTNEEWSKLEELLPKKKMGRPCLDLRRTLSGIKWILKMGNGINLSDAVIKAHRINITAISLKESITS